MKDQPYEPEHYFDHIYLPVTHDRNARRTNWVIVLTAVTMVAEIVAGWLTGSMALLADGFHMGTHAGALAVTAVAYAFARRNAKNAHFTFGTGKVGDLAGFASAIMLALASIGIALESLHRLWEPLHVDFGDATVVAAIGLAVNVVSAALLMEDQHHLHDHEHGHGHGHGHGHEHGRRHGKDHGRSHSDSNLRAAYLHVLADALTSVAAIVALLAGRYLGLLWLDPAIGVVGAVVIARWSWGLMRDTAGVLLDTAEPQLAGTISEIVENAGATIADLHVWRVGPHAHAAIVSIRGDGGDTGAIRTLLYDLPHVVHVTVERC